ncbi:MAG: glycosyltransferase family 4 protein [Cyclobacteriaceae bacterium]
MKSILFIDMHREGRSPSQRFRYEQYLGLLRTKGFVIHHSFLLSEKDDTKFYSSGNYLSKGWILVKSISRRIGDLFQSQNYDFIFIQREAFMLGTVLFERLLSKSGAKLIVDFDDAIWLHQISSSSPNQNLNFLKRPSKTSEIIKLADTVVAGNSYLANYALQFNTKVQVIPTTIDTDLYTPRRNFPKSKINIGWSGSRTTVDHFKEAIPALERLKQKYGDKIEFTVIGDGSYHHENLGIIGKSWSLAKEVSDLQEFDIGIMPLPNDEWSKGKCGLKGLQYMALEIPTIMSPVGVNTEIIHHTINGFLASTSDEWVEYLGMLIEKPALRQQIGIMGRKKVVEHYSVVANSARFLSLFE